MYKHKTKDGRLIQLRDISDGHLFNIIKNIEKMANSGIVIKYGGGYPADDIWYDEEIVRGKEALAHLNYKEYIHEFNKRNNSKQLTSGDRMPR